MGLLLVGSGNAPLQPIADFLQSSFRQEVALCYAPQLALSQLQSPENDLPDAVVADISGQSLPGAMSFLHAIQFAFPDLPVLLMVSVEQAEQTEMLLQAGSMDVLPKPVSRPRLRIAVMNALRMRGLKQEVHRMRLNEQSGHDLPKLSEMNSANAAMQLALVLARRTAKHPKPVWLQGEYGTGKETLARAMHAESDKEGVFHAVRCGGQTENVLERQLFGGASRRMVGAFAQTDGGMLYLDEVEQLPARLIESLAKAMQEAKNPWLVVSTRRPMTDLFAQPELIGLLHDRWNLTPIALPPVRERQEDIVPTAQIYLNRFAMLEGRIAPRFSDHAVRWLHMRRWTGNLPELSRTLHRALWMAEESDIEVTHLEGKWPSAVRPMALNASLRPAGEFYIPVLTEEGKLRPLAELEDTMLQLALKHHEGCMARAARALGIGRSTLYRKLQERGEGSVA